jgi:hypothetical protein
MAAPDLIAGAWWGGAGRIVKYTGRGGVGDKMALLIMGWGGFGEGLAPLAGLSGIYIIP